MDIRNIAIIAHVDHGKTTLTDMIMRQYGSAKIGVSMDSNALELERGITIYSKNTSVLYKGSKINIIDTPGHADFGSEVERVLRSIDSVVLLVDAQEGPMSQTRYVLKKSLELGHHPIVVLNKIDKPASDTLRAHEEVLELFFDLGADDSQLDFQTIYAIGRDGVAMREISDARVNLDPLLDCIIENVSISSGRDAEPLGAQAFNLAYDNFLGRMAIVRIYTGVLKTGSIVIVKKADGRVEKGKLTKLFLYEGLLRKEVDQAVSGDIALVAGISNIYIGDTICDSLDTPSLPYIKIDEPTIALDFLVNNSPFAGREGTYVTARQIKERLEKELEINVGLKLSMDGENMKIYGRGELHIAILLENMRREGYEMQVSQPQVIIKDINGIKSEPFEEVIIDVPKGMEGMIIEKLAKRGTIMVNMKSADSTVRITFEGPTRGLLGYRGQFVVDTKGEGIITSRVIGFKPYAGIVEKRVVGSMTSMAQGKALGFALNNLQTRGVLYIAPGAEVYEGMVVGNTSKGEEMVVNPTKGKQLTNMRSKSSDDAIYLAPAYEITIERGLEIMSDNEYLEVTPKSARLRKQSLRESERAKNKN
jgi:GTP-binding protein